MSEFVRRHIGPSRKHQSQMLKDLGLENIDELVTQIVPESILISKEEAYKNLPEGCGEEQALTELREIADKNTIKERSGQGYYETFCPPVIQRNVLENPAWYTSYTPYQAEISQGRLEALFNFQTLITELTGLPIANASLLDEGTAAAEAMIMSYGAAKGRSKFVVDANVFPQTLAVIETRAKPLDIEVVVCDLQGHVSFDDVFGMLVQLPGNKEEVWDPTSIIYTAKEYDVLVTAAIDPFLQVLMKPVAEMGADIAVGSCQRFGIPMGNGGPHAAYFATIEKFQRKIPGRIVGQSVDKEGNKALRLALQTREQHIRRDKATSNICTAQALLAVMAGFYAVYYGPDGLTGIANNLFDLEDVPLREKPWLQQEVFNRYHSETELMRYIYRLAKKDFTLIDGMIPLGSCTMKLNAAAELMPVSWPEFANIHPFLSDNYLEGYYEMIHKLEEWLCSITGFEGMFLQPNAGSQGEYAGLLTIREYHESRGDSHRNVCLIPTSAHGTNPASSVMAGMKVVAIKCKDNGDIDLDDLREKASTNAENLACIMVTYPSTHGVFEPGIREICEIVHEFGGQVYMDGANLNAQVGLSKPGQYGVDVCHLNLHKTFCIPHGGGGPGVGPIGIKDHLIPFVPQHISAAPYGSASILPIPWMYIRMMGGEGLRDATEVALLNANWIADQLEDYFPVLYRGPNNRIAHECILDIRPFKQVTAEDVAKRLMDYGFHAPTLSWPVAGTVMVEPTESESFEELQRFVDAMKQIRHEIDTNPEILKNAPHIAKCVSSEEWDRSYTRQEAAYPMEQEEKFWPAVARIDNVYGDRNLVCSCQVEMNDYV